MMKTLGAKLEEARVNKGISIQEAAERTKIRASFLESFEKNKFDIDLPEIYRKGFVKNYAELLELNVEEIENDYLNMHGKVTNAKPAQKGKQAQTRENFGKFDLGNTAEPKIERDRQAKQDKAPEPEPTRVFSMAGDKPAETNMTHASFSVGHEDVQVNERPLKTEGTTRRKPKAQESAKSDDKMIWGAVGVSFAALLVVVGFLAFMFKDDPQSEVASNSQPADSGHGEVNEPKVGDTGPAGAVEPTGSPVIPNEQMGLEAKGGDVHVILIDKRTGGTVFDQTILDGEAITVDKAGPMAIIFDKGDFIFVRLNEKLYKMPKSGPGRTAIP